MPYYPFSLGLFVFSYSYMGAVSISGYLVFLSRAKSIFSGLSRVLSLLIVLPFQNGQISKPFSFLAIRSYGILRKAAFTLRLYSGESSSNSLNHSSEGDFMFKLKSSFLSVICVLHLSICPLI